MVKNRFNSLLRKATKSKKMNLSEEEAIGYVIELLESSTELQETRWGMTGERPVKKAKEEDHTRREDSTWRMIKPDQEEGQKSERGDEVGFRGEDTGVKIEDAGDVELKLITSSSTVFKGRQEDQVWRIIEPPPKLLEKSSSEGRHSSTLSKSRSFRLSESLPMNTITLKPPTPQAGIFEPSPLPKTP